MDISWAPHYMLLKWLVLKRGVSPTIKRDPPGMVMFQKDNICHIIEGYNIICVYSISLGKRPIYLIFEEP